MSRQTLFSILTFFLVVLFTILVMPHLGMIFRPNLLLVFVILFSFTLGFQNSIWFWIISGVILDNFISSNFPINSVIFIILFILLLFFSKVFDYSTKMSQVVTAFILISIYYFSWFFIDLLAFKKQSNILFVYLLETLIFIIIFFKIKNKDRYNEKNFQKI